MNRLQTWLKSIGWCDSAIEWAGDRTLKQTWDECERGDYMLWLLRCMAGRPGWPTLQTVVGLCCDCAELAKEHWRGHAPAKCIATLRAWCRGEATLYEVIAAADAAVRERDHKFAAAFHASCCAARTADARTASAADVAFYASRSASAAASAVAAAAIYAAADAYAARAAYTSTLLQCAAIVRAAVPTLPEIDGLEGGES